MDIDKQLKDIFDSASRQRIAASIVRVMGDPDTPIVICEYDLNRDVFVSMSESCFKVWGYKASEMRGKSYKEFCHPDYWFSSDETVQTNAEGSDFIYMYKNVYFHKDGSLVDSFWFITKPDPETKINICFCLSGKAIVKNFFQIEI